jgi:hypothetical protein
MNTSRIYYFLTSVSKQIKSKRGSGMSVLTGLRIKNLYQQLYVLTCKIHGWTHLENRICIRMHVYTCMKNTNELTNNPHRKPFIGSEKNACEF